MSIASVLAALAGVGGFLGVVGLCAELVGKARRPPESGSSGGGLDIRLCVRTALQRLGRILASARRIRGLSPSGDLDRRLVAAGQPAGLGPREWIALKAVSAALAGLAAGSVGAGASARIAVLLMVVAPGVGFVVPDFWLARLERRRIDAVARELPDMLDLLRVTVEAGMAPARAFGLVAAEFRGTLAREWRRVAAEVALGVPQDEAFAGLRARLPGDEVGSLVESLGRARRHGAPLGRALDLQAARARERRRRRVREQAARAGPKIQLVVALLLVPAVLLIVAAGLLSELQRSGTWLLPAGALGRFAFAVGLIQGCMPSA